MCRIIFASTLFLLSILCTTEIGAEGLLPTNASTVIRSCEVSEILGAASYTYVRCVELEADTWLAVMHATLNIGEQITFYDTPPMIHFTSKELKRTFSKVMFVREFWRNGARPTLKSEPEPKGSAKVSPYEEEPLYTGTDDSGTLIFTDDPSKRPQRGQSLEVE